MSTELHPEIWRLPVVIKKTGRGRSSIWNDIKAGTFPKPIKLGARSVGWLSADIIAWIEQRIAASRGGECHE
jgi:prophage regulatory protein